MINFLIFKVIVSPLRNFLSEMYVQSVILRHLAHKGLVSLASNLILTIPIIHIRKLRLRAAGGLLSQLLLGRG